MARIMPAGRVPLLIVAPAIAALASAACGSTASSSSDGGGGAPSQTITATNFQFDVTTFSVASGASVTVALKNNGGTQHTFVIDGLAGADTGDVNPGSTGTATFTAPASGTLLYHCHYHPSSMHGTITVGGGGGAGSSSGSGPASTSSGYGY